MSSTTNTLLLALLCSASIAGCAGMSPVESGYVLGSIAGGAAAGPAGAAIGSAVGSLAGVMVAKPLEQHREKQERQQLQNQLGAPPVGAASASMAPPAEPPATDVAVAPGGGVVTRVWVDERLERGHVLPGHFEARALPAVALPPQPTLPAAARAPQAS